jgi:indolepyruvate ferredoxin oxidoreductase alpha subunit
LEKKVETKAVADGEIPVRPPVMCPGCPHRGMFYVLKKLKLTVSGDIGCYTLGALPPTQSMDTCVCMGASIGVAHGMEKARGEEFGKKTVAVRGNSTVIILDNSITGMTGHQQNPTTGFTIKGEPTKQVDLEKLCNAVGIDRVRIADPFNIKEFEKIVKEEIQADEPSVIISQRPCALLKSVKFEGALKINNDKCKYCKMCLSVGCPAIVDKGDHVEVNEALCVGCMLCTKVCNFDAFLKAGE